MSQRLMIITTVSPDAADVLLDAIAQAGGGRAGFYTHCAFTNSGFGRFKPSEQANPHVGSTGTINSEAEIRIETFCERAIGRQVVAAIRQVHPYEEPVIHIVPLLDEGEL